MNQLDRIEAKLDQLLAARGEAPAVTGGVTIRDGIPFSPGTGTLGGPDLSHANCSLCDGHGNQFNTVGEWAGHCQGASE